MERDYIEHTSVTRASMKRALKAPFFMRPCSRMLSSLLLDIWRLAFIGVQASSIIGRLAVHTPFRWTFCEDAVCPISRSPECLSEKTLQSIVLVSLAIRARIKILQTACMLTFRRKVSVVGSHRRTSRLGPNSVMP